MQWVITIGALLMLVVHNILPSLTIDTISVTLLFLAMIPWLAPLFKSIELPGGWKFEFKDFERARQKADEVGLLAKSPDTKSEPRYSFQLAARKGRVTARGSQLRYRSAEPRMCVLLESRVPPAVRTSPAKRRAVL